MERLCIYPKDIMRVTGRSERYGRNLIQKIRQELKKETHQRLNPVLWSNAWECSTRYPARAKSVKSDSGPFNWMGMLSATEGNTIASSKNFFI